MNWGEIKRYAEEEEIPDDVEVVMYAMGEGYEDEPVVSVGWRRQGGGSKCQPIVAFFLKSKDDGR